MKQIANYAIAEVTHNNTCVDIQETSGNLTMTLDNEEKILPTTFGYRVNNQDYLIYCIQNLTHFGRLTRLLSLYGRMEIDTDGDGPDTPIEIYLSPMPNQRVLYF